MMIALAPALAGCSAGLAECEREARSTLPEQAGYQRISAREEPGETPAMTYWIIEYLVTDPGGAQRREYVHCAYMRDMEDAQVQRLAPPRAR
ncbi:hypothetical protein [Rhizorhabdus sp. FW153]|uniref:hypothetical protein n=1 Tax=Rhizorhabdus sp. FW153 TaxID=3400216 RepID=UPI003CF74CA1